MASPIPTVHIPASRTDQSTSPSVVKIPASSLSTSKQEATTEATLSLPPQTTPFVYHGTACTPSVWCPDLTQIYYSSFGAPMNRQKCYGIHTIDEGQGSDVLRMGYNESCFPSGFYTLFPNQWRVLQKPTDLPPEGSNSTLAYPGTECPWGWTTACTPTYTHTHQSASGQQQELFPQAHCCPPGGWSCTNGTGDLDPSDGPQRLCKSLMTESTTVFMSWDPPATLHSNISDEQYTWPYPITSEAPENAATVFHHVFPLSLTTKASIEARRDETTVSPDPGPKSMGYTGPYKTEDYQREPLTFPSFMTIITCATFLTMGLVIWWVVRYRKRGNVQRSSEESVKEPHSYFSEDD